ncbi:hypothetical protein FJT64_021941 [Amphibalanus amphitrite]|uniref:LINE-1 type transposase domain-containing protein 1 n=1 Tax=Amphibalanus amphitrite TaxID=1232801 RepID=A0A6A4WKD7_AMPAM|nr:hypothetical protein FJT64_021941 [Amphibalanus amphitrite]
MLELNKGLENRIEQAEKRIVDSIKEAHSKDVVGEQLQDKIKQMEKTVKAIKDQQMKLDSAVAEQKEAAKEVPKFTEQLKNSTKEIKRMVDSQGKAGRECNLIIHNIPESDSSEPEVRKKHDLKAFEDIVAGLLGDDVKVEVSQVYRLGKKAEAEVGTRTENAAKKRLMLLKLREKEHVNELIRKRTLLRDVGFPNVYLTRDLSPEEREQEKALREELEKKGRTTHVIFRGRVVPRR